MTYFGFNLHHFTLKTNNRLIHLRYLIQIQPEIEKTNVLK